MCAIADYWPRIKRIPLFFDREISDGESVLYRAQDGSPVRVTKPDFFKSDEERAAAIEFLEANYSPRRN